MTFSGLGVMFERLNYLWPDQPIQRDPRLAEEWDKSLKAIDDEAVFEALPILAQHSDRRPSLAQLIQQSKAVVASRPPKPQLTEGKSISPYSRAWMTLLKAWRDGQIEAAVFQPVAQRHELYFRSGNPTATTAMVEESQALLQHVRARREEQP